MIEIDDDRAALNREYHRMVRRHVLSQLLLVGFAVGITSWIVGGWLGLLTVAGVVGLVFVVAVTSGRGGE